MQKLTQKQLQRVFKDVKQNGSDTKFCFLLGAGASKSSGIPLGSELAKKWYDEIVADEDKESIEQWKNSIKLDENSLGSFYPEIYKRRFMGCKQEGYRAIQKILDGKEPSIGYAFFAQILSETEHKFVITTNFDTLIEDALFFYSKTKPLVCGHESLANYIKAYTNRPTVIKVHRDVLLDPMSDTDELKKLKEQWKKALQDVLSVFHLVVIGYDGNDGGLMEYLEELDGNRKPIYWCVRSEPKKHITNFLKKDDYLVNIEGFDELMIELHSVLGLAMPIDKEKLENSKIVQDAKDKAKKLAEQINEYTARRQEEKKEISPALKEILPHWWDYQLKADNESDIDKKDAIYKEGIDVLPKSHELIGNYALFLKNIRKDYDSAEGYYKKTLEIEPHHATYNGNYASFLHNIRKDYDSAEMYYKKALEIEPNNAINNGNYAPFLKNIRKDYDSAERYYKKALEIEPNHANNNGNYAIFLSDIRKDYDSAERYYKKALEIEPDDADFNGNYALFLEELGRTKEAKEYRDKANRLKSANL